MKNPAPYLRKKLFALLSGNVIYNDGQGYNQAVPVREEGSGSLTKYQIFIGAYSDGDRSNKENFVSNASQVIEVVSERTDSVKKYVDEIGDLVSDLIHPTTRSELLSGTDFQVMVIGKPSINHIPEDSGSGTKIVRLILRYNLLINEN